MHRFFLSKIYRTSLFAVAFYIFSALSVNAQYGNLLSKAAADALGKGDSTLCEKEMKSLILINPKNIAARVEYARCIYLSGYGDSNYKRLVKSHMADGATTQAEAEANADANIEAIRNLARQSLNEVWNVDKNYSPAYNLSGLIYLWSGDAEWARKEYDRAVELDPKNYRAFANRGKLRDDAGDAAGAIADYEKVGALGIDDPFIAKRLPELKRKSAQSNVSQTAVVEPDSQSGALDVLDPGYGWQDKSEPKTAEEYVKRAEESYRSKKFYAAVWNLKKAIELENAKTSNKLVTADSISEKSAAVRLYEKIKSESDPLAFKYWDADLKEFNYAKRQADAPGDNDSLRSPNVVAFYFYRDNDKWRYLAFVLVRGVNKLTELNKWSNAEKLNLSTKFKQPTVVTFNKKTKLYEVWNVVAVAPTKENLALAASTYYRESLKSDPTFTLGYDAQKLNFDTALIAPPKDFFFDQEVVEILDADGLSLVSREKLHDQRGAKGIAEALEREVKNENLREAKQVYVYFSRITEKSAGLEVVKTNRKLFLSKLYGTKNADLQKFVEEEMTKWNYADEEKKLIRRG